LIRLGRVWLDLVEIWTKCGQIKLGLGKIKILHVASPKTFDLLRLCLLRTSELEKVVSHCKH